ncbi:cation:dicarboxylase symporter family transporter [Helicobacter sp. faydin-H20]|uniref:cation:dicarboxylate symporter family transporter n=1 Tax=Helicobacter anatolicus TaxID=2905874 RepID=UPI001E61EC9C|nr:cation:dicarboxylase symporter family transporter [Helicobacter anatolicus]MCE3036359.1 cation:dicarboxylase symporter family transporter [Helicobacter anatolicus]
MQNSFLGTFVMISQWQTLGVLFVLFMLFFMLKKMQDKQIDFSVRMLIGLFCGICFGIGLQFMAGYPSQEEIKNITWLYELRNWFGFFGDAFVGFIKMLVIPIIGISIIKVMLDIDRDIKLSSLLTRALFWILFTAAIAGCVGVFLGYSFHLGLHVNGFEPQGEIREVKNLTQILLGLIPSNIIDSMLKNNVIALVIFAFLIGFGAKALSKEEGLKDAYGVFEKFITAMHKIIMDMTLFIIRFMPYAVICMMSEVLLSNGLEAIKTAVDFIILIYIAMMVMFVVYAIILLFIGLNPLIFFKKALPVFVFAFTSRSSVGTLPLNVSTLHNKLGVSTGVANFVASIGTTIGINGCAGYFPAFVAIFIANTLGVQIDFSFIVMIVLMVVLGSLGIAGVPGAATMAASIMLTGIGFGDHFMLLSIVLAIDPIIDMARTTSNVAGAMVSAICTDKGMGSLNKEVYNG